MSGDVRTDTVLGLGYVYDAVWTIALALNSSISILEERGLGRLEDFTYESVKMADVFTEAVLNVSFEGISVSDYYYAISIATQTASCVHDACTYNNTVYTVHLADIKFSKLICDVNGRYLVWHQGLSRSCMKTDECRQCVHLIWRMKTNSLNVKLKSPSNVLHMWYCNII